MLAFDAPSALPAFDDAFRHRFETLLHWRRDVRRFRIDVVDPALLDRLLALAALSPSVGNSQPWRFVMVNDPDRRAAIRADFARCNRQALAGYHGERADRYARLKLAGLDRAPIQLAVFADTATTAGHRLGQNSMPETLLYSVVCAVHTFWLAARAHGLGMGWVSILDPSVVQATLDVPATWRLVAFLCLGYPEEEHLDPELARHGWQERLPLGEFVFYR